MKRIVIARALLAVTAAFVAGLALAADAAPGRGPGWTGITNPKDVIAAREELMVHIEELMQPIDTIQVKDAYDPGTLRFNAEVITAMLLALPHLFPPTTNRYDPKDKLPETLALPGIWKNFGDFYKLAAAASVAATEMAETEGLPSLKRASLKLRASCDACHTLYLLPYEPPKVLDSDLKFDFDSALRKK
ncbi:MAG: cytochrome c [Gammaproteobacteria bacterium]